MPMMLSSLQQSRRGWQRTLVPDRQRMLETSEDALVVAHLEEPRRVVLDT
jgi:hypothetical protein